MLNDTILVELHMEVIDRHRPSSRRGLVDGLNFTEMRNRLDDMRFTPLHWAAYMVLVIFFSGDIRKFGMPFDFKN